MFSSSPVGLVGPVGTTRIPSISFPVPMAPLPRLYTTSIFQLHTLQWILKNKPDYTEDFRDGISDLLGSIFYGILLFIS